MMTLRYIFHSGFLLETKQCILVFDYWMDSAVIIEKNGMIIRKDDRVAR